MSVGFNMAYRVIIKGSKADFELIPAVAQAVAIAGRHGWSPESDYPPMAEYFADRVKAIIEFHDEPFLMELENSDDDATHGIFEDFLNSIDKEIPGLSIAIMASNIDTEYWSGSRERAYYSPAGSSIFDFDYTGEGPGYVETFPDEDWISYGWRHMDEKAPAAKADGTVALLGDWSEAEKDIVDKALMGNALEAMGYTAFEKDSETVVRTDEGWTFRVGGEMNAGEVAQNLHLALLVFIEKNQTVYTALCKVMREKKLAIHLYLNESTSPNAAWVYSNNSAWHFLITSNGAWLVSKFTWCRTHAFGSDGGSSNYSDLYEKITEKAWNDLTSEVQFMVMQAISQFSSNFEMPSFPNIDEWIIEMIEDGGEEWEDYVDDPEDIREQMAEFKKSDELYRKALAPVISKTIAKAEAIEPPVRFFPQTFDRRFEGKTFVVKGDLDGYKKGQVQEIIEKFSGKVSKNITLKTTYIVCGRGVGDAFKTALKHNTPFLSADYFEDMTR